jgi:hypothetical protein
MTNTWKDLKPGSSTLDNVIAKLGRPDRQAAGASYGNVKGFELLMYDDLAASVFMRGGRVAVIVVVPRGDDFPANLYDWEVALGRPSAKLPSIKGKNARVYVYSEAGLTATSANGRSVILVEVFPPMKESEYERTLYKAPPKFIK